MEGLNRKKLTLAGVLIVGIVGFWTGFAHAESLPNPPPANSSLLGSIGVISVLLSTANIPVQQDAAHTVHYTLPDGSKIGGLLYMDSSKGNRPLIIADFGLMSSANSTLAGDIIEQIVNTGMLNANFLVVDDISGADFYVTNESISLGGYDAGRVLTALAYELGQERVPFTTLHLMGESLGGLAVLEALIEDHRQNTHFFTSAITFSGVTNEAQATASVMSAFNYYLSGISGPKHSTEGELFLTASVTEFDSTVSTENSSLPLAGVLLDAGNFFYSHFTERLEKLNEENARGWNPAVSRVFY